MTSDYRLGGEWLVSELHDEDKTKFVEAIVT